MTIERLLYLVDDPEFFEKLDDKALKEFLGPFLTKQPSTKRLSATHKDAKALLSQLDKLINNEPTKT